MGVRGLQSFLKENRQSLCRSVLLDRAGASSRPPTPAVVDAWGIIYQLYLDTAPWTSGGEYLRFYRVVRRLIRAWRSVGLEPTFVFDGPSPPEKHETLLKRMQAQQAAARMFYTISPATRSAPSFARNHQNGGAAVLPPFALHAFTRALSDENVPAHYVAAGEADGMCVVIAEELCGFVVGNDTDFAVLACAASDRMRGYVPLDMMEWTEAPETEDEAGPGAEGSAPAGSANGSQELEGSWRVTAGRRPGGRRSRLLPTRGGRNPLLVLATYSSDALCRRLRLPPALMPLLASLVGNDYTPPTIDLLFPAGAKVSERIERVARTLREQHATRTSAANHGDAAADFVRRVVAKLCCRPYTDERTLDELTDAVIEATIQYVLPLRRECCALHPFCEHERYASSGMSTRAHTPAPLASSSSSSSSESAAAAYAAAQRRGHLHLVTHSWLYPGRVYLWSGLEDPSGPCGRVGRLAVAARTAAYLAIEAGLGGMRYPAPTGELLEEIKQDHEACKLLGVEDGEAETGAEDADQDQLPTPAEEDVAPPRTITEYGRQGSSNRIIVHAIDLPAPLNEDAPCLAPLDDRLNMYLKHLGADTPEIRALPPRLHPFVAVVRLCIAQAAEGDTAGSRRWRRSEVEAVLRAGIGCLQGGWADVDAAATDEADNADSTADYAQGDYPLLTNRSAELVSQLTCAFIDAQLVAQALLLTPEQEVDGDGDRRLTHMSPYVFFSGVALHSLLAGVEPGPATQCGWHWSVASCNGPYHSALAAVLASLPEDAVATGASLEAKKKKKKDKDKKRVNGTGAAAPAKSKSDLVSLGSRFDALLLADI